MGIIFGIVFTICITAVGFWIYNSTTVELPSLMVGEMGPFLLLKTLPNGQVDPDIEYSAWALGMDRNTVSTRPPNVSYRSSLVDENPWRVVVVDPLEFIFLFGVDSQMILDLFPTHQGSNKHNQLGHVLTTLEQMRGSNQEKEFCSLMRIQTDGMVVGHWMKLLLGALLAVGYNSLQTQLDLLNEFNLADYEALPIEINQWLPLTTIPEVCRLNVQTDLFRLVLEAKLRQYKTFTLGVVIWGLNGLRFVIRAKSLNDLPKSLVITLFEPLSQLFPDEVIGFLGSPIEQHLIMDDTHWRNSSQWSVIANNRLYVPEEGSTRAFRFKFPHYRGDWYMLSLWMLLSKTPSTPGSEYGLKWIQTMRPSEFVYHINLTKVERMNLRGFR